MSDSILVEAGKLQDEYNKLLRSGKFTKQAVCDLCIPFRDKYGLSDIQTLKIARRELSISQINDLQEADKNERS